MGTGLEDSVAVLYAERLAVFNDQHDLATDLPEPSLVEHVLWLEQYFAARPKNEATGGKDMCMLPPAKRDEPNRTETVVALARFASDLCGRRADVVREAAWSVEVPDQIGLTHAKLADI